MPTSDSRLIEKGKLLTLTTDEALTHGVADFRAADTLERTARRAGLEGADVRRERSTELGGAIRCGC
jgi:hypothetical protein